MPLPGSEQTLIRTRLARLRLAKGLTQEEMVERTGLSRAHYWRLETGRIANPTVGDLAQCAIVLGVPLEELIEPQWREWNWARGVPDPRKKRASGQRKTEPRRP